MEVVVKTYERKISAKQSDFKYIYNLAPFIVYHRRNKEKKFQARQRQQRHQEELHIRSTTRLPCPLLISISSFNTFDEKVFGCRPFCCFALENFLCLDPTGQLSPRPVLSAAPLSPIIVSIQPSSPHPLLSPPRRTFDEKVQDFGLQLVARFAASL